MPRTQKGTWYRALRDVVLRGRALKQQRTPGVDGGLVAAERAELDRLRKESRELKQANEILKLASAFFARELDPRHH